MNPESAMTAIRQGIDEAGSKCMSSRSSNMRYRKTPRSWTNQTQPEEAYIKVSTTPVTIVRTI